MFPPRLHVEQVAAAVEQYRIDTGYLPMSLDDLLDEGPAGLGPYIRGPLSRDHWGRALLYSVDPDGRGFTVFSLGRDGRLGGRGADEDVESAMRDQIPRK
ncbi:MAG: type II secretion system protein GspG [Xanthomonadaceae bacterium]|nr:type II secretion system protein GspG [Xanthomonadaceae bacterium]